MSDNRNYISKWQDCLSLIRDNVGKEQYELFFKPAIPIGYEESENKLVLQLPTQYFVDMYESPAFYNVFTFALRKIFGMNAKVVYSVNVISDDQQSQIEIDGQRQSSIISGKLEQQTIGKEMDERDGVLYDTFDSQLNPRYNFENYCVGRSNKLAHTIAEFISKNPDKADFNPFFLFGNVGVGKTHLIQAIGIRIKEQYPRARVLYTTMRRFINEYSRYYLDKKLTVPQFVNWYSSMDVLLIDDLQELSGKEGTMNALYPIFNHLHQNNRKLIFTCDRPPVELEGITDRLIDRFKWGMTEELPKPDYELRKQILEYKSRTNGLALPEAIIDMIASRTDGSIRELEGIVLGIITNSITLRQPITEKLAEAVMRKYVKDKTKKKREISFDEIVDATADRFNLSPDVIYSKSRVRDIADARQVIMFLARELTNLSFPAIGARLNRNHPTVTHGYNAVKDRISVSKEMAELVNSIKEILLN